MPYFSDYHYLIVIVSAITLDWLLGEPKRYHPIVFFGRLAEKIEIVLRKTALVNSVNMKVVGIVAVATAIVPFIFTIILILGSFTPLAIMIIEVGLLYFAIGNKSLAQHANRVLVALNQDNLKQAKLYVSKIVSRETRTMNENQVTSATIESVLENGNDAVFAVIFWYLMLGAPGIILYRLSNTLDAMWGYKNKRYINFGWAAAKLDDGLNWLPSRLCAFTYALVGNVKSALNSWSNQAKLWESPNAGVVMSAGAGALGITLGGGANYQGAYKSRPVIGFGRSADYNDISRAINMIQHGLIVWVAILAIGCFLFA